MSEPPDQSTVALIGLQGTGKSTYVVAFFLACESSADGMCITNYCGNGNREYLNKLAQRLADCEALERTRQTEPGELRLKVILADGAEEQQLLIPDLSGELLRDGMATRHLDEQLDQLVASANGTILFMRSDRIVAAETLADFNTALERAGQPAEGATAPERPEDWELAVAPTQVRLVDAVQELLRRRGPAPLRLALVLSAWDTQSKAGLTPLQWAQGHLALLTQLLDGQENVQWSVFGVSAQGGDFCDAEQRDRLKEVDVSVRATVAQADGSAGGVGAPVRWALGLTP